MLSKVVSRLASNVVKNPRAANFSTWSHVQAAPPDPILGLNEAFKKDTNPKKVLLGMGTYKDDNNKPYVLSCIRKAEKVIQEKQMDHEYAPIEGISSYIEKCVKLAYGEDSAFVKDDRVAAAQSISGTGSLRLGFETLRALYPNKEAVVYTPNPTWPVHNTL